MNLSLLGARLGDLGDWPDLHTPPYPGPVLWVAGARSDYITPEYGPAMRTLFPRTTAFTIKNAGHWVHSEQPEIFLAVLRRFLGLDQGVRQHALRWRLHPWPTTLRKGRP